MLTHRDAAAMAAYSIQPRSCFAHLRFSGRETICSNAAAASNTPPAPTKRRGVDQAMKYSSRVV